MKRKLHSLFIVLAVLAGIIQAAAQGARFFRISGPAATTIMSFNSDGTLVWSNALAGTNYTIQTVSSLSGGSSWVDYVQISATNGVNTDRVIDFSPPAGMALIPAGVFTIGDITDNNINGDAAATNVTLSAFYMDVNLVSLSQWQSVYNWASTNGYGFNTGHGKAANHPVQTVDWYDAVKWSNARSQQAGLTPVYYTDAGLTQVYKSGEAATIYPDWAAAGYRLPTEAEWEKAARGGLSGQRFPWGNTISESQANYYGDTNLYSYDLGPNGNNSIAIIGGSPYTSPVASFPANGYGLYDMAGNLWEWCWDWYNANLSSVGSPYAGGTEPRGPASSPYGYRVIRGGDWYDDDANGARCAYRFFTYPTYLYSNVGFRCVRGLFNPPSGMALIPAGSFTMGNSIGDSDIHDANPTNVYVSAFFMDMNPVSYSQWQTVFNWATNNGYGFDHPGAGKAANHPVQTVDWYDAVKWCNARSQQAGLPPVYYTDAGLTQVYTNGDVNAVYANWTANGYRLPTEAEWEKAARGGLSGQRFPWGNTISESQANYYGTNISYDLGPNGYNSIGIIGGSPYTSPLGSFAPNGYGLYDMAGNVWQWCWDWYATPYAGGSDPRGPASGTYRVAGGGFWTNDASWSRCAFRDYGLPSTTYSHGGFRCARGH